MATILTIESLTKSVGDRTLFHDISLGVEQGEKIGVVARNGTGKSTLLSILAGQAAADSGNITTRSGLRIAYLPQTPVFPENATVVEAALDTDDPRATIVRNYSLALAGGDREAIHSAVAAMDAADAWNYQDLLAQTLGRMGLDDPNQSVAELSGGQRKRLALARIVMAEADLLLLDEPTNHLDISTIEWLEAWLGRSRATLIMVTHDRYFLDRVCNRIIEMDAGSIFSVAGNYDMYLRRRAERLEAMDAELARTKNILRKEQEWMSRQPQARGSKARFRIDNFHELTQKAARTHTQSDVRLETTSSRVGSKIFEARDVCKAFGSKIILSNFTYTFAPGEKIGIVGPNGVGKSTFIKMLLGLESTDAGAWNIGTTVRFGYYSQDGIVFDQNKKVIDAVQEIAEDIDLGEGRRTAPMQYLQRFLFSPADQQKYIYKLSGGERCRLHLAVVLMQQPNFLILDEPTNDLDIITLGILEEYLAEFKGCVMVVSHDRFFLDSIVDHLFVMEGNGQVRDFPGNYTDYRQWCDQQQRQLAASAPKAVDERKQRTANRPPKLSYRELKELEALEQELKQLEDEKKQLEAFFTAGGQGDYAEKSKRLAQVNDSIDEKELRWLELSEKA